MRNSILCLITALGAFVMGAGPVWAVEAVIEEDGMLAVDGTRVFVLGLYENPGDDAVLEAVQAAGFNLVRASASTAALDRLEKHGLYAWVNTGTAIDLSADAEARAEKLAAMAADYASHPALLVWEVPDEALWNCWYRATQWRRTYEPGAQREAIAALDDSALAGKLAKQLGEVQRLFDRGEEAAAEAAADAVWEALGQTQPKPGLNLSNAAERAATLCAGMIEGYAKLKALDPAHPIWMNHAPRNQIAQLAAFNAGADIAGCDIYPAPPFLRGHSDLGDRSLTSVGAYTDRMQAAAPDKPVWMVLQGFGWADLQDAPTERDRETGRRPDWRESRFMAYDAIVHGARGVLYWGTSRVEKDSALWRELLRLAAELDALGPVLAAPDAAIEPEVALDEHWGSLDRGVRVLGKNVDGAIWWLVVNEYEAPLHYTLRGLTGLEGTAYSDVAAGRHAIVTGASLRLPIRGYGVHVLAPLGR